MSAAPSHCAFQMLSSHSSFLAHRVFKFRSGSNLSFFIQIYATFIISGIVHTPWPSTGAFRFFLSQAVAITFEEIVIALAARAGLKRSNAFLRSMGLVWVYCWFVYSLTPWYDFLMSSGAYEHGGTKLSLIMGLYQGKWIAER
jgi:hypothetical protein